MRPRRAQNYIVCSTEGSGATRLLVVFWWHQQQLGAGLVENHGAEAANEHDHGEQHHHQPHHRQGDHLGGG